MVLQRLRRFTPNICYILCSITQATIKQGNGTTADSHDDVIKWKHFLRNWPFVRGIHRSPVNSPHKGQCRGALMFSLICVWINDWVNNREAGDLRRYRANSDVIAMHNDLVYPTGYQSWQLMLIFTQWLGRWYIPYAIGGKLRNFDGCSSALDENKQTLPRLRVSNWNKNGQLRRW